jgi:hypothetical protein
MKKVVKLKESDLINIIKQVLVEQSMFSGGQGGYVEPKPLKQKYTCTTPELSGAAQYAISQGIDPFYVKYALGILGRESDFGQVMGKFGVKAVPEYTMNKLSELIPGFKDVLQWGAKKIFNKKNWVPSMGVAQMTPDIAKKYNVNLEQLMSVSGSLVASSKYLMLLYNETKQYYDSNQPSKIIYNKQLIDNPSSSGNAALDAAIMSYNLGSSKFKKQYCKTNSSEYLAPCNSPNGQYRPFPKDNPNLILKVDTTQVIKNYIPNIKTDTTGIVDKQLNKYVRDTPTNVTNISSLGYLKEVVGYSKKFECIK